jgi:hypothetical protein
MPNNDIMGADYIGGLIGTLVRAIRRQLVVVIAFPVLAMATAYYLGSSAPRLYEAQASIKMGRTDGTELVGLQNTISRLNSPAFKARVAGAAVAQSLDRDEVAIITSTLAVRAEAQEVASIKAQALKEQDLRQVFELVVRLLNEDVDKMREPFVEDVTQQLKMLDDTIDTLSRRREALSALEKSASDANPQGYDKSSFGLIWANDLISRNEDQLRNAKTARQAVASRVGPWRTYPATQVDAGFIVSGQIAPRPMRTVLPIGGLVFVLCVLYALLVRGDRKVAAKP